MRKNILVPYDFSNASNFAIEHAIKFTKSIGMPIKLIHVVSSEKEIFDWKIELEKVIKIYTEKHKSDGIIITGDVRSGDLVTTIYNYGLEVNTFLAVMGTHGSKTIHKAIKLIRQFLKIPFILVQRPMIDGNLDKICVPITNDKKLRVKIQWVRYLEIFFKSKVLLCPVDYKNSEMKLDTKKNVQFATDVFAEYAIDFDIYWLSEKNITDNLYDYMYIENPELVLFMTDQYKKIVHDIKLPQNIEFSKKIPVMCVNYRTDISKLAGFN